ncbi:MAG: serine/threonine-protein kinase, partial [Cyanobacteria bacterium P01_A01_bin.17]
IQDTLRIGLHLLEALRSAEQKSIVHRDVKPDNIIIDTDGNAWLIDFGLARHLNLESLTATSDYFGACTPGYAPPEQFRNQKKDIDARADLFALGVTLYECIEGKNPFQDQARDVNEVIRRVEKTSLPALSKAKVGDSGFSDLVQSMTRRWPNHRLKTINEALIWIKEITDEEEV